MAPKRLCTVVPLSGSSVSAYHRVQQCKRDLPRRGHQRAVTLVVTIYGKGFPAWIDLPTWLERALGTNVGAPPRPMGLSGVGESRALLQ